MRLLSVFEARKASNFRSEHWGEKNDFLVEILWGKEINWAKFKQRKVDELVLQEIYGSKSTNSDEIQQIT